MIHLDVDPEYADKIDPGQLRRAAEEALKHEGQSPQTDLALVITDDDHLYSLNKQFLGVEAPTDVLSFPAGQVDPDTGEPYLGDVLISFPQAEAQANARSHPVEQEIQLLVVHGVLHLLGHDHSEPGERESMWAAQAETLARLGFSDDTLGFERIYGFS